MSKSIDVDANDFSATLLQAVSLIKENPVMLEQIEHSRGTFMDIREIAKEIFDSLDNRRTERYIGVLEWSVVQQILDNMNNKNNWLDTDQISERFFGHPNIRLAI